MPPEDRFKAQKLTNKHFASVINAYLRSPKFMSHPLSTRRLWGLQLERALAADALGGVLISEIRPSRVQAWLDGFSHMPPTQAAVLAAIKQVEAWAVVRDLLPREITKGCEVEESDGGHIPWPDTHVELATRHARADIAQAIVLQVNTGQRGSDLIRMRWSDIEEVEGSPGINVTEQKTKKTHWVPFTQELIAAVATWERRPGFILLTRKGRPWTRQGLTEAWTAERDINPALAPLREVAMEGQRRHLVLHGLRGCACVRLLRAGLNTRQISDVIGMSEPMVARYTRFSEQKQNALAAIIPFNRTAQEPTKLMAFNSKV